MATEKPLARYRRQIDIEEWATSGQNRLAAATVFVAGLGGLGGPLSLYLAAAGVGHLRICDHGSVKLSNLNRQILYGDSDIGARKATAARERLLQLNPGIEVIALDEQIADTSVRDLVGAADVIVDCLDTYSARLVLNGEAVTARMPLVHAGVQEWFGQLTVINVPQTPCLRCIYSDVPDRGELPIVGATAGALATLQATEVIKLLTGIGATLEGTMLHYDGASMTFHTRPLSQDPECPACGGLEVGREQ